MQPLAQGVRDLLEGALLFLARHGEALDAAESARRLAAVEGMLGLPATLLPAAEAIQAALEARAAARGGDLAHEATALAALRKRGSELEGALLHLRLTLQRPANAETARRAFEERYVVSRSVEALESALHAWAGSVAAAHARLEGAPPISLPDRDRPPRVLLRAAREALLAEAPEAAAPLLLRALRAGLAAPLTGRAAPVADPVGLWRAAGVALPSEEAHVEEVLRALAEEPLDMVLGWALLDAVERLVGLAAMTPLPEGAGQRAAAYLADGGAALAKR